MIASLNISLVLHGTHKDRLEWPARRGRGDHGGEEARAAVGEGGEDPFQVPKEMGIFQEISRSVR